MESLLNRNRTLLEHVLLALFSLLLLLPWLGEVHLFDWDEINFAESAREMLLTSNYLTVQIDFEPFWEKPPFFFWLQAFSMKIFADPEFAARFPNALAGLISMQILLFIGRKHALLERPLLWPLMYLASLTPFFYFKSGIIDPWFNLWIFLAVYFLYRAAGEKIHRMRFFALSGLMLGMAFITKGPVAILLSGLAGMIYWISIGFKTWFNYKHLAVLVGSMLFVPLLWLTPEMMNRGIWFLQTFFQYQIELLTQPVASHGQPWYYHSLVLLFGAFPASVIALPSLFYSKDANKFDRWMRILFWVVLVIFSLVTTKIVHYSSLCFFPLSYLAARSLNKPVGVLRPVLFLLITFVLSLAIAVIAIVMSSNVWRNQLSQLIRDEFTRSQMAVSGIWMPHMALLGLLLLLALLFFFERWKSGKALLSTLAALPLVWLLIMHLYVPAVERHTQYPLIQFMKSHANEEAYWIPYRYKTYAHLFYASTRPLDEQDELRRFREDWKRQNNFGTSEVLTGQSRKQLADAEVKWLIEQPIRKRVYVTCVQRKAPELSSHAVLKEVFREGGYVIFLKEGTSK